MTSGSLAYRPADTSADLWALSVGDLLSRAASLFPSRTALVSGSDERRWTFAELDAESSRVGELLAGLLEPGDRIAVWSTGIPEWLLLQFGAARAGVVLVPLNPAYQQPELAYALRQSRARAVCFGPELRGRSLQDVVERVRNSCPELEHVFALTDLLGMASEAVPVALPQVAPGQPVMIQYTSGTTGTPKGALLTHRSIVNNARFAALRAEVESDGVWLNPAPLFHTGGCVFNALGSLANGSTHVLMPSWDPGAALELIERERATFLCCVATMMIGLLEHSDFGKRDLSSMSTVISGGSTVPPDLVRHIESAFEANYMMVFGQTEAGPTISMNAPGDAAEDKANTVGFPLAHTEVKIANPDDGCTVPYDTAGEICVRGYGPMTEYFELPAETATALDADGWLHTGDLGQLDHRGFLQITGRLKDIIRRGGETISPRAIEDVLFQQPGVGDVAVVGVPDPKYGERPVAFIRRAVGADVDIAALRQSVEASMAYHKVPQDWFVLDEFPVTPSGKIQKFVLRERYASGDFAEPEEKQP